MKSKTKTRSISPLAIRMQPDLKSKLEEAAAYSDRSINAELVHRLEDSFKIDHGLSIYSDGELIDELIKRWGREACYIKLGTDS